MVKEGLIDKREAVLRVAPQQLDQLLHPLFDQASLKTLTKIANGIDASPGAAVGRAVFDADEAVESVKKGPVILIRKETTPDDIHGMEVAAGVLTAVGGKSSHAAVVARGMGLPCVVGAGALHIEEHKKQFTVKVGAKDVVVKEGDWISFDGTTADVYLGQAKTKEPDPKSPLVRRVHEVGRRVSRRLRRARQCRYSARCQSRARVRRRRHRPVPHRAHVLRGRSHPVHAGHDSGRRRKDARQGARKSCCPMQRKDFAGLFEAMDGYPVIIRTLDPPLHEFLPKRENLMVDLALLPHAGGKEKKKMSESYGIPVGELKKKLPALLKRVEDLHEFNPMLGFRGCRLGIVHTEITEMQARAIFEAAVQVAKKGIKVIPEVMIPLVGFQRELAMQKEIVERVAKEVLEKAGMKNMKYLIGTMIEIPRGALTADQIAEVAQFFSFGTNDLTQTTLGMSRDDYTKFSKKYEELKIFKADPFQTIDQEGVGKLIEHGREAGPHDQSQSGNRHLRRARRRSQFGRVLLPRGHGLRFVLALSRADRAAGGGASGHRRRR